MIVRLRREAVVTRGFVFRETLDGPLDFVDGEGALLYLPPLAVVEDRGDAFDFVLGVRCQCVLAGGVLLVEAVLGGPKHRGQVVDVGAVCVPDCGDGVVAEVGHGVVEVAYGLAGEFVARISLVFWGDALLSVAVPLLQVRPDVGYLCSAVVYVVAGLRCGGEEEGCQLLLRMPQGMEHITQGCGWLVVLSLGLLQEAAGNSGRAHGCE